MTGLSTPLMHEVVFMFGVRCSVYPAICMSHACFISGALDGTSFALVNDGFSDPSKIADSPMQLDLPCAIRSIRSVARASSEDSGRSNSRSSHSAADGCTAQVWTRTRTSGPSRPGVARGALLRLSSTSLPRTRPQYRSSAAGHSRLFLRKAERCSSIGLDAGPFSRSCIGSTLNWTNKVIARRRNPLMARGSFPVTYGT